MNNIDKFQQNRFGRNNLFSLIQNVARSSGCSISWLVTSDMDGVFQPFHIVTPENDSFVVRILPKNISGAGWPDKPEIKRIQVRAFPEIPRQQRDDFRVLCGIGYYDSQYVLAMWDPLNYMTHSTTCSCYVFISSLEKAVVSGSYYGLNKGKEVFTCDSTHFGTMIKEISSRYC